MQITVLCFASVQDVTGQRELSFDCPEGSTVRDAVVQVIARHPDLAALIPRLRFAVDAEFVDEASPLRDGCTLALLPPMSGG